MTDAYLDMERYPAVDPDDVADHEVLTALRALLGRDDIPPIDDGTWEATLGITWSEAFPVGHGPAHDDTAAHRDVLPNNEPPASVAAAEPNLIVQPSSGDELIAVGGDDLYGSGDVPEREVNLEDDLDDA